MVEPVFENESEAFAYLDRHRELLKRSLSEIDEHPDIDVAKDALRAELIAKVKPLIEAKRDVAVARLRWSLWHKLDETPPSEIAGGLKKSVKDRATEADDARSKARTRAEELEADEEISAALILLRQLDEKRGYVW